MYQPGIGADPESSLSIQEYCVSGLKGHTRSLAEAICGQVSNMANGRSLKRMSRRPERAISILDHAAWSSRQSKMSDHSFALYVGDPMGIADPKSPGLGS
jgi:hypothetical protein